MTAEAEAAAAAAAAAAGWLAVQWRQRRRTAAGEWARQVD